MKLLIERGANVNAATINKYTALIRAAENGLIFNKQFEVIQTRKKTSFWKCCLGNLDVVELLLENGADVNAMTSNQATSLAFAAWEGQFNQFQNVH